MADIRPWFMPWRRAVHEDLTRAAARQAGYTAAESKSLVRGSVDNDLGGGPWGTYRRHFSNEAQPTHGLRKREHTGPDADRQALAAVAAYIRDTTLLARARHRSGEAARALFLAGKALHTVQDTYFHSDRDYAAAAGRPQRGRITHVRSYLGPHADHDSALDSGLDAAGQPTVHYRAAERASYEYLLLVKAVLAAETRTAAETMLETFLAEHLAQP